ncbi:MAG: hypothetical protein WCF70_05935, partial [Dehalococcoidales bacterium]|jgi:hypothetical protein
LESYNIAAHPAKNKITVIIRKARIPLVTLAAGILLGVLLPAYISPMLAAHVKIAPVQSIISEFCPNQQLILEDVPIKTGDVVSAVAQTTQYVSRKNVDILVNPAFSTYALSFQTELLTHEYLHILQAEDTSINIIAFHQAVQLWFNNFNSGLPVPSGTNCNYTKYYLYFELYNSGRYTLADYPKEEYAYIGTMLAEGRQADVPANIQAYYKGILNCE